MGDKKNLTRKDKKTTFFVRLQNISKLRLCLLIVLLIIALVIALFVYRLLKNDTIGLFVDDEINSTPTQIIDVKRIGQWDFLSIEDEEMVDTIRKGIFSDDHLVRIYYGTLHLGFDLSKVKDDWINQDGDKISVTLPQIGLLDERFIDEARTKSFYSSGHWSDQVREDMYKKAYEKMIKRCLTLENLKSAEENAHRQFYNMFKALGYKDIEIEFEKLN